MGVEANLRLGLVWARTRLRKPKTRGPGQRMLQSLLTEYRCDRQSLVPSFCCSHCRILQPDPLCASDEIMMSSWLLLLLLLLGL